MALFWRIWTAVLAVALCVLALFVGLATLQFGSINASLVGERLQVLAERTASPFAAAVRIGLPLRITSYNVCYTKLLRSICTRTILPRKSM